MMCTYKTVPSKKACNYVWDRQASEKFEVSVSIWAVCAKNN